MPIFTSHNRRFFVFMGLLSLLIACSISISIYSSKSNQEIIGFNEKVSSCNSLIKEELKNIDTTRCAIRLCLQAYLDYKSRKKIKSEENTYEVSQGAGHVSSSNGLFPIIMHSMMPSPLQPTDILFNEVKIYDRGNYKRDGYLSIINKPYQLTLTISGFGANSGKSPGNTRNLKKGFYIDYELNDDDRETDKDRGVFKVDILPGKTSYEDSIDVYLICLWGIEEEQLVVKRRVKVVLNEKQHMLIPYPFQRKQLENEFATYIVDVESKLGQIDNRIYKLIPQ